MNLSHESIGARPIDESRVSRPSLRTQPDLICLSHLRWGFVFQRPQHVMTRFARDRRVFYVEEPVRDGTVVHLHVQLDPSGVHVVVPHVPTTLSEEAVAVAMHGLLGELLHEARTDEYVLWYLTPMALTYARDLEPLAIVFDCMDDLGGFRFAPPDIASREGELLGRADVVFTGGRSLYEAKRTRHSNVHCCPSSVDAAHFASARNKGAQPGDQAHIATPRLGYAGVIDERMDVALIGAVADRRPDWQIVLLGPIVKIDPSTVPHRPNIHLLGAKSYADLPCYLAHWDVALLPFAHNAATRFISPTKTPEYLAAGLPVVSTSIRDVVTPYGDMGLVQIADTPDDFIRAIGGALTDARALRLRQVDAFLADQSWESTWTYLREQVDMVVSRRRAVTAHRRVDAGTPVMAHGHAAPAVPGQATVHMRTDL